MNFWKLILVTAITCVLISATIVACGDDDDDDNDEDLSPYDDDTDEVDDDADDDIDDDVDDDDSIPSLSDCEDLIIQIYDFCQININEWVRDMAFGFCIGGENANWPCIIQCTEQFPNDCQAIFTCAVSNCS